MSLTALRPRRSAQVFQQANNNYLDALATVDDDTPLSPASRPGLAAVTYHGSRVRALRVGDLNDLALL